MNEAKQHYREALDICRRLAAENPPAYEPDVAAICNNLGLLLKSTNRMEEAEGYYREALDIDRRLAAENPAAFEPYVAGTCNNLGILLDENNQKKEAEQYYREALDIRRRLAGENLAAFEPDLAISCFNLGLFERNVRHHRKKSKALFREAYDIWKKYPHHSQDAEDARKMLKRWF